MYPKRTAAKSISALPLFLPGLSLPPTRVSWRKPSNPTHNADGLTSLSRLNLLKSSSDSNFAFWSGTTRGILKMNLGFGCSYSPMVSKGSIPARAAGSFMAWPRGTDAVAAASAGTRRAQGGACGAQRPLYLPYGCSALPLLPLFRPFYTKTKPSMPPP